MQEPTRKYRCFKKNIVYKLINAFPVIQVLNKLFMI